MNALKHKPTLIGIIAVLITAVLVVGFIVLNQKKEQAIQTAPQQAQEEVVMLPADALSVALAAGSNKQYVLTIDKIPEGVSDISYEITYNTTNKGAQGIVGSVITLTDGQTSYKNDKIIFGSCSSGKCVYDQGVSDIQINIKLDYKDSSVKGWKGDLTLPQ